ncbi:MAG TPA: class I SAM-dependent methyltransferase family protein [Methanocella sp.]
MVENRCVVVPRANGETVRRALAEAGLLVYGFKIRSDTENIYLPVVPELDDLILEKIAPGLKVIDCDFEETEHRKTIEDLLGFEPSFEVIGDIAVLAQEYDRTVGEAIMAVHKSVKVVLVPVSPVSGEFRVREFKVLCGENRTTTTYREHGFVFEMDLAKVYFSPRLSTERLRVVQQVSDMEFVVDMFAGVGPFAIPMAKRAMYVIAVDKNPSAYEYLQKNIKLNHVKNIEAACMDARDVKLPQPADRVIMNLPHTSFEFLDKAFQLVRVGGIIHYYDIRPETEIFDGIIGKVKEKASECGVLLEILNKRIVRSYSPHEYNIVLDIRVTGKKDELL